MKAKKLIAPLLLIGAGIVFLLIPGLEPLGAITILGGVGTFGVEAFGK